MKKYFLMILLAVALIACNDSATNEVGGKKTYENAEGKWKVEYDSSDFETKVLDDNSVQFTYIGKAVGSHSVVFSYIKDCTPEDVLNEVTGKWGNAERINATESTFPGTNNKWGFWRTLNTDKNSLCAIAGEYNGGVMLMKISSDISENEEDNIGANDAIAELLQSIKYEYFGPQTTLCNYYGTFVCDGDSIVLLKDHHGSIRLAEKKPIMWGSDFVVVNDFESVTYALAIDGDKLTLTNDGKSRVFTRDRHYVLPAYECPMNPCVEQAVCDYLSQIGASMYSPANVSIPVTEIIDIDESNPDDIKVWGDFWVYNYNLNGTTLKVESGGCMPGVMHVKKNAQPYMPVSFEVMSFEQVTDGGGMEESAKKLFGDKYDKFAAVLSHGRDKVEATRARMILDYVNAFRLSITHYQDYGGEPVKL